MKAGKIKSLFMFIIGCFYAVCAYSATSLFSDYGQIQNVQNYSTNPFWSPNAPYNQKMPQPVYVQGNAVTTDECIRVIQSAVAFQCAARDNCRNTQLTDIRPAIIVQLSNLPGKAYGTACAGYLDSVFESYVAQYGNNAPTRQVAFPDSTIPNPSINNNSNTIQIKNPYEIKTPQWQQEINERSRELQELQSENGAGNYGLSATAFPTTYNDLSFTDRMANEAIGYEPYKDKSAYKTIDVKNAKEWCNEHDGPECDEYYCQKGGPKANEPACIQYRCAKPEYEQDNKEECICAKNGATSFECMNYRCNQNDAFSKSTECHNWKCTNDRGYAAQPKNKCNSTSNQVIKNHHQKNNKTCAQLDHNSILLCCDDNTCTKNLCNSRQICEFTNDNKDKLCYKSTKLNAFACCYKDSQKDNCLKEMCTIKGFSEQYQEECKKTEISTQTSNSENNIIKQLALSLCDTKKFPRNKTETIFNSINTPNNDWAKLLAQMILYCTENINHEDYNTETPSLIKNAVHFVNRTNYEDFIKIQFNNIDKFELFRIDNIYPIWSALCYISGGTDDYFDRNFLKNDSPLVCKKQNISDDSINNLKNSFNILFGDNISIKNCVKDGKNIAQCYLQ